MNTPKPFFSIIVTNYNNGHLIGEAISSALSQSFASFEIIVADNCSSDNSWSVIESFFDPKVRIYKHKKNLGMFANLNFATSKARGNYLKFLNSDDALHPHCLECLWKVINKWSNGETTNFIHIKHDLLQSQNSNEKWLNSDYRDVSIGNEVDFVEGGLPNVCVSRENFLSAGAFGHPNNLKDFSRDILAFGLSAINAKKITVRLPLALERIHSNQSRHAMMPTKRYQLDEYLFIYNQSGRSKTMEGVKELNNLTMNHFRSSVKYLFKLRDPSYLIHVLVFCIKNPRIFFCHNSWKISFGRSR
jgi:glycosyltransferase involved in cell wall biosynthesis